MGLLILILANLSTMCKETNILEIGENTSIDTVLFFDPLKAFLSMYIDNIYTT